jgi:hypothetical protein
VSTRATKPRHSHKPHNQRKGKNYVAPMQIETTTRPNAAPVPTAQTVSQDEVGAGLSIAHRFVSPGPGYSTKCHSMVLVHAKSETAFLGAGPIRSQLSPSLHIVTCSANGFTGTAPAWHKPKAHCSIRYMARLRALAHMHLAPTSTVVVGFILAILGPRFGLFGDGRPPEQKLRTSTFPPYDYP